MTVLQLRVVLATAELKSVSAAAKFLNISQPNASTSLRLLEEEVGFPILQRGSAGSVLTPKGAQILENARQILDATDKIYALRTAEEIYRLRLGTANYYTAAEPFYRLCAEHRDDAVTDFRYHSVSISEGIQALLNRELDVVAAPVMQHQIAPLRSECRHTGIEMTSICCVPAVITLRRNHPAALDGRCRHIQQGSDLMKDYPYVALRNLSDEPAEVGYNDADFIQCSYKIYVDDTNVRLRMVESCNGFYFGIRSSYRLLTRCELVSFPVPGITPELFCLTRSGETTRREIREYMTMLKKEMLLLK